jgi:hypothetical protein
VDAPLFVAGESKVHVVLGCPVWLLTIIVKGDQFTMNSECDLREQFGGPHEDIVLCAPRLIKGERSSENAVMAKFTTAGKSA